MSKLSAVFKVIGRFKIPITIVVGVLFLGLLCDTSVVDILKLDATKNNLEAEVEYYRQQAADAKKELDALSNSHQAVEKVAREKYNMKYQDEDIFVLSTDTPDDDLSSNAYAAE